MKKNKTSIFNKAPNHYVGLKKNTPCFLSKKIKSTHFPLESIYLKNENLFFLIKKVLSPLSPIINWKRTITSIFIDGFIEKTIGKYIRRYVKPGNSILEIGVGSGKLIKYIDIGNNSYCGLDIYDVSPVKGQKNIEIIVADAEQIPLFDNSIDVVISTETLEHIPHIKAALNEIYRVCKNGSKLIISIPNNYCHKYKTKGPHPEHINNWHYYEFIKTLEPKFTLIEGQMKGCWIPILKKSKYSLQISNSCIEEYYNTNFFYVFECKKQK